MKRILYLDCGMGAAGDMLTAALLELVDDRQRFIDQVNSLGLPRVEVRAGRAMRCGITGTQVLVEVGGESEVSQDVAAVPEAGHTGSHEHHHDHDGAGHPHHHAHDHGHVGHPHDHPHDHEGADHSHEHRHRHDSGGHPHHHAHDHDDADHSHEHRHPHDSDGHPHDHDDADHSHRSLADVTDVIESLPLPVAVKNDAVAVYRLLAEAEGRVHDQPMDQIHFHEVGTLDAITDIVSVALLLGELQVDQVFCSPVSVGGGRVRCAHGVLPVPTPATTLLLRDVPVVGGPVDAELCTPTGAALLRHFVDRFVPELPAMSLSAVGHGMGAKQFEVANCVRAVLGTMSGPRDPGRIVELACNLDDMTGEQIAFAAERLFAAGALDVQTTAVGMKKGRPGVLLSVLAHPGDRDEMVRALFVHTTTLGVREYACTRHVLDRSTRVVDTRFGSLGVKLSQGWGVERTKPEYEDVARIARERGLSLDQVRRELDLG